MSKIKVGISIGDLNGIGVETIIKTFKDNRMMDFVRLLFLVPLRLHLYTEKLLNYKILISIS